MGVLVKSPLRENCTAGSVRGMVLLTYFLTYNLEDDMSTRQTISWVLLFSMIHFIACSAAKTYWIHHDRSTYDMLSEKINKKKGKMVLKNGEVIKEEDINIGLDSTSWIEMREPLFVGAPGRPPIKRTIATSEIEKFAIINHNIEVVKDLFSDIRLKGDYKISLSLLSNIKKLNNSINSKSGFMVGIGETYYQIIDTMKDLRKSDVDFLTIGQYLQPTKKHSNIKKYYTPDEFNEFKKIGLDIGFKHVESGPLVRSSYHAADVFN